MSTFIPVSEPNIDAIDVEFVTKAVQSGWVSSLGEYIKTFENQFTEYCERTYGTSTANGTVALHLALLALDIGKDDEVIVPNLTFIATANAVTYVGAKSVLVDIEPDTWNMDPQKIEAKITPKTKAIMVVHLYGHPCDMDPIMELAKKYNLKVIEDAAEAHGAKYQNRKIGSFGDISCFSFYGNKTITTGEGGMCLTDNKGLYDKMVFLKDHGMDSEKRYWHPVVGYNYRITNLQAALGVSQLKKIESFIEIKRKNAELYKEYLRDISWIVLPVEKPYAVSTYWMFSILLSKDAPLSREVFMKKLKEQGIDSRPFFYPLSDLPPYAQSPEGLEVSTDVAYRGINLPSSTVLKPEQIKFICGTIRSLA